MAAPSYLELGVKEPAELEAARAAAAELGLTRLDRRGPRPLAPGS